MSVLVNSWGSNPLSKKKIVRNEMKLSIIIPVYNAEKYLGVCLASIFPEMNDDIELLLIDDGSKDLSYQIIQEYRKENIRIFHHENHGVSYTRNIGIMQAQGDYILFVDADDKLSQGWKNILLSNCRENADVIYFSENFDELENIDKFSVIHGIFGIEDSKCDVNMSSPCSKLYRRDFLLKNQIKFDEQLINGEDGIFNLNVILKAEHFACCRSSFYQYRIYMDSSSKKYSDKFYDSNIRYFSLAENLLKDNDVAEYEIKRCMSYAVTYSVYLYLFLIASFDEQTGRKKILQRVPKGGMKDYMDSYPCSVDCNKGVQLIFWLVKFRCGWLAEEIVNARNKIKKKQEGEMKWVKI